MLPIVIALLSSLAPSAALTKGYTSLAQHVDNSTLICIGCVDEVFQVKVPPGIGSIRPGNPAPIARIRVESVIKGDPGIERVYHEAWATWACDTTSAHVGERAVFLLTSKSVVSRAPADVRRAMSEALATEDIYDIYRNVGSGDGILTIAGEPGKETVTCVGAPNCLKRDQAVRLTDLVEYIRTLVRFSPEQVLIYARSGMPQVRPWPVRGAASPLLPFDLRVLEDGTCRLATAMGGDEEVRVFTLPLSTWSALQGELHSDVPSGSHVLGDLKQYYTKRLLTLRLGDSRMTFSEAQEFDPAALDGAQRTLHRQALQAWTAIRSAIDCPECADSFEADRVWIDQR